jgi:hypothetical protein
MIHHEMSNRMDAFKQTEIVPQHSWGLFLMASTPSPSTIREQVSFEQTLQKCCVYMTFNLALLYSNPESECIQKFDADRAFLVIQTIFTTIGSNQKRE